MFWWRISKNSIPTFALLSYRRLINHEGCPRGCLDTENTDHIVRRCFFINKVFKLLEEWNFGTPEFDSVEDCYQVLSRLANINPFLGNLICSVIFYCYKSRNQLIHGGCDDSCYVIAYRAVIQSISSFKNGLIRENWNANQLFKLSKSSWLPPPLGWIKVNVDASIFLNNSTGIEGIFRDYKGRGLAAFGFHTIHWDIAQKELLAILSLRDLIKDWMLEAKGIVIEGDNINVINIFQNALKKNKWNHEEFLNPKDLDFLHNFQHFIFSFVNRDCNKLANFCANYAHFSSFFWDDFSSGRVPPSILELLKVESSCNN
ncbi:hypothetical protein MA16_Dca002060 [Dendrobium catenatum]|uniref:RNase H type-1 domain-containing protein n=1 Tax=Dendrobium catenatum TaxID=906689 RepID=A0A2I0XEA3_9ASPA|nr:hypothetical protein MA16_Dca002060 [Dendrobium catenatum]